MLAFVVGLIARIAMVLALSFAFSSIEPTMPRDKTYRFVFLFVLGVPLNFIINFVNVRTLGYHNMGWTGQFIMALLFAAWGTFLGPQPHNPNTP
jgi:hypothetical protein